jgi:NADH dehydrogenase
MGIPGDGRYLVQPVHVDDLAALCVEAARGEEPRVIDAVGPEILAYRDLVDRIRRAIGSRARLVAVPIPVALVASRAIGQVVHDVVLTRDEIDGLTAGLLVSNRPPACPTSFSAWISREGPALGRRYASELARHFANAS